MTTWSTPPKAVEPGRILPEGLDADRRRFWLLAECFVFLIIFF